MDVWFSGAASAGEAFCGALSFGQEVCVLPSLREACGVFGVYAPGEDVARITFFVLYALKHRGQESAGIATSNSRSIYVKTGMGLASQAFDQDHSSDLPGRFAMGHTRDSTTGSSLPSTSHPFPARPAT